jgi:DNA-binding protein YbaB
VALPPERQPVTEGPQGRGTAGNGQIVVTAAGGGLHSVELDPRSMRLGSGPLAGQIMAAANAALDDLRAQIPAPAAQAEVDLAAVAWQLPAVRDQATRELSQIVSAIQAALADLRRHAQVDGRIEVPDAAQLFEGLERILGQMSGGHRAEAGADPADEEIPGLGQAGAGGLVWAVAVAAGRVVSLTISPRAIQEGSRHLAGYVVTAVNGALEEAGQLRQVRGPITPVDNDMLRKQLAELREASLQQMQAFSSSLSSLLGTIRTDTRKR